jgi:hypothetical protein
MAVRRFHPEDWRMPILLTALLIAVLDACFAFATVWSRLGTAAPERVMKAVAAGILGKAAATGGAGTIVIGALSHFTVALGWTAGYFLVARRLGFVQRLLARPNGAVIAGAIYGAVIWFGMCYAFIPMSRTNAATIDNWRYWANFVWHMVALGPIIVFSAERGYFSTRTSMPDGLAAV